MVQPRLIRIVSALSAISCAAAFTIAGCGGSDADEKREQFEAGLRGGMSASGAPTQFVDCVVEHSRTVLTDEELDQLEERTDELTPLLGTQGAAGLSQVPPDLVRMMQDLAMPCVGRLGGAAAVVPPQ